MATVCQVYDETNAVVLFDLNDPTTTNVGDNLYSSTELLSDVDLGSPAQEFSRFTSPGTDGGSTVNSRAGFRQVTLGVRVRGSSYDNLTTAVGKLSTHLRNGCVIRWQANTSSNVRYIDVEPSPSPYVLDGRELSMYLATSLIDTPEGLELVLTAQPYLRGAEIDSASNLLTNATLMRDADGAGRPDGYTWSSTSNITNEAITNEAYQFDIDIGTTRQLGQTTPNSTVVAGETWTMSGYARVTDPAFTNGQIQAMIEYQTNAGAVVNTITGTLGTLTTGWTRVQASGVALATATKAQVGLRVDMTSVTPATLQLKNVQFEEAAAATPFTVGSEVGTVDPSPTSGIGRLVPFYNPGDAPCPVTVVAQDTTSSHFNQRVAIATNKGGPPGTLTTLLNGGFVSQCEAWTPSTDTALDTNAASSPGSGNTGLLTTFVTTTATLRGAVTNLNAAAHRGRTYRAFVRFTARTAAYTGTMFLQWSYPPRPSGNNTSVTVTSAAVGTYYEADLGLVTCPDVASTGLNLGIGASRSSGTGNLVLDYVLLVPVDEQTGTILFGGLVTNTNQVRSYPEDSLWLGTTSAGVAAAFNVTGINGPIPFYAEPGLNLVQISLFNGLSGSAITPDGSFTSLARTDATAYRFIFSPRFLS